jgi:hypothetical protein
VPLSYAERVGDKLNTYLKKFTVFQNTSFFSSKSQYATGIKVKLLLLIRSDDSTDMPACLTTYHLQAVHIPLYQEENYATDVINDYMLRFQVFFNLLVRRNKQESAVNVDNFVFYNGEITLQHKTDQVINKHRCLWVGRLGSDTMSHASSIEEHEQGECFCALFHSCDLLT